MNGTVTWNWPPNDSAWLLWNQREEAPLRSIVKVDAVNVYPEAGVNVTFMELRLRVVV